MALWKLSVVYQWKILEALEFSVAYQWKVLEGPRLMITMPALKLPELSMADWSSGIEFSRACSMCLYANSMHTGLISCLAYGN